MDIRDRATIIGREVIYTEELEDSLRAIEDNPIRADEFICGAVRQICRFPEIGDLVDIESKIYGIAITDLPGYQPAVLYYTFNDNFVWALYIGMFERDPDVEYL